jgi:ATP-binding cassette, subfamily F, member 3
MWTSPATWRKALQWSNPILYLCTPALQSIPLFTGPFSRKLMYSIQNLSIHFTGEDLFKEISFLINPRDRIGLVGRNGVGKTTLLRIINGDIMPDKGEVVIPSGKTIGFLPQEIHFVPSLTVREEALKAFEELNRLETNIAKLNIEISTRSDYESDAYHKLIANLSDMTERVHLLGGANRDEETEKVLLGLGFKHLDFDKPLSTFSGGWQMRVVLAKLILQRPDLIMLDEPTNHLDIESITWLESYLNDYQGAVILVSHERAFLDNVTQRTIEISGGKVYDFKAPYSKYVELREQQLEHQQAVYANQQQEIKEIERFIERFRYKATKAKQVQSRVKMLEKIDTELPDGMDQSAIHFRFPPAPQSGKVVFEATGLGKAYGTKQVLGNLEFAILKGDAVAFVGRNGEGKTTLSRIIVGELDHTGTARSGHNVKIGYFAQNQAQILNGELTILQTLEEVATEPVRTKLRAILGGFLFHGNDVDKKVKVLSGGEKTRLALARMLLTPVNFLVLDEPTNHLDMRSKDILKNALIHFDGTLIVVSHDRDFLQGLTTKVFEFRERGIRQHLGDVYDFLATRQMETFRELEQARKDAVAAADKGSSDNKKRYEQKKEEERIQRKIKAEIQRIETSILTLEEEKHKIEQFLANPSKHHDRASDTELYKHYTEIEKQLSELYAALDSLHD